MGVIEFVEGEVAWAGPNYLVIKEGGIGYRVVCPRPYLWDEGKHVRLSRPDRTGFVFHAVGGVGDRAQGGNGHPCPGDGG
ncbi:MAG: OB-fold domain-containing protein [Planifilum fimeticola]